MSFYNFLENDFIGYCTYYVLDEIRKYFSARDVTEAFAFPSGLNYDCS
jgi:hypothetical protein